MQKTAYEMRISDWSSDVCSSDLHLLLGRADERRDPPPRRFIGERHVGRAGIDAAVHRRIIARHRGDGRVDHRLRLLRCRGAVEIMPAGSQAGGLLAHVSKSARSEEHTSELQSLMRIPYAAF